MTKKDKIYLAKLIKHFQALRQKVDKRFEKNPLIAEIDHAIQVIKDKINGKDVSLEDLKLVLPQEDNTDTAESITENNTDTDTGTDKENVPQISQNIPEAVIAAARTVLGILGNVLGKGIFAQGEQLFTPAKEAQGQLAQLVGDGNTDTNIG